jgi:hypothetical protein
VLFRRLCRAAGDNSVSLACLIVEDRQEFNTEPWGKLPSSQKSGELFRCLRWVPQSGRHARDRRHHQLRVIREAITQKPIRLNLRVDHEAISPNRQATPQIEISAATRGQELARSFGDPVRDD